MLNLILNTFKPKSIFFLMDNVVESELNSLVGKEFYINKLNTLISNKFGSKLVWKLDNTKRNKDEVDCGIQCYSVSHIYSESMVLNMSVYVGTTNIILYTQFTRQKNNLK